MLTRHPLSEIWGSLSPEEEVALQESFDKSLDPALVGEVVVYEGKIIDGFHRLKHAERLGRAGQVPVREFTGRYEEAVRFCIRANGARRHSTPARRADVIVAITRWTTLPIRGDVSRVESREIWGDPQGPWMTKDEQTAAVGVGPSTIEAARKRWLRATYFPYVCPECQENDAEPGKRLCSDCQEKRDALPTPNDAKDARIEELEQENRELRGQFQEREAITSDDEHMALQRELANAQAAAAQDRNEMVYWKRRAKEAERKYQEARDQLEHERQGKIAQ